MRVGLMLSLGLALAAGSAACEKSKVDGTSSEETGDDEQQREDRRGQNDLGLPTEVIDALPAVPYAEQLEAAPGESVLVVGPQAITLDGKEIVTLSDWKVPSAQEGSFLVSAITDEVATAEVEGRLLIAAHRDAPYRLLFTTIASAKAKPAAVRDFGLLVAVDDLAVVPISLPEEPSPAAPIGAGTRDDPLVIDRAPTPEEAPIRLVIALSPEELTLFSLSGMEGSIQEPKVRLPGLAGVPSRFDVNELGNALSEIVERRWKDGTRPDSANEIIVMADNEVPMSAVAAVMAVSRESADGTPRFPALLLATGFQ